jgi:putative glutamine amidotransferase
VSRRPVVGIPTQTLQAIDGIPPGLPHSWVMNRRYYHAITAVGAVPWMIPLLDDDLDTLREIFDRLDGLVLAGGVDVHPCHFGEAAHPALGRTDAARDAVEIQLARWALAEGMPLFGLCRGLQVINVARGGTLHQDIATQVPSAARHDYFPTEGFARDYHAHTVTVAPWSILHTVFGDTTVPVNSMHHQAIKHLGDGLLASAHSPDGLIEAVETPGDHWVVGVQWHPEMFEESDPKTRALFQAFIDAANRFGEAHRGPGLVPAP